MLRNNAKQTKPNKSEQSQKEIAWLQERLNEIKHYTSQSFKKQIHQRIKNLQKTFKAADKEVNSNYRNDFRWQELHGIEPQDAMRDKVWNEIDQVKLQNNMTPELDNMMHCRNIFIFEEMQQALKNELEKAKSSKYDDYKDMLKYTLNEINQNKSIPIQFPCNPYYHFTSFPKAPVLTEQVSARELSVFSSWLVVTKNESVEKVEKNVTEEKRHTPLPVMSANGMRRLF